MLPSHRGRRCRPGRSNAGVQPFVPVEAGRIAAFAVATAIHVLFQDVILRLQQFWGERGCALLQPYDM